MPTLCPPDMSRSGPRWSALFLGIARPLTVIPTRLARFPITAFGNDRVETGENTEIAPYAWIVYLQNNHLLYTRFASTIEALGTSAGHTHRYNPGSIVVEGLCLLTVRFVCLSDTIVHRPGRHGPRSRVLTGHRG